MQRTQFFRRIILLTLTILFTVALGTTAFAQSVRLGEKDPWKGGKILGSYVKTVYGSTNQVPKVLSIASKTVVVQATSLNVRSGPGSTNKVVSTVKKGATLKYIKESAGWVNVGLPDGKTGWLSGAYVKIVASGAVTGNGTNNGTGTQTGQGNPSPAQEPGVEVSKSGVIKGSVVNVRSGPGTNSSILFKLSAGKTVKITREAPDWYKIKTSDGKTGWVASSLITIATDPPSRGDDGNPAEPGTTTGTVYKLLELSSELANGVETVTIRSEGSIKCTTSMLQNPWRLVIDMTGTEKGSVADNTDVSGTLITGIRTSQFSAQPATVRIVIDLTQKVAFKTSLSEDKRVLTIQTELPTAVGKTVVIDPGHGGYDSGAVGVTGLKEKEVNLAIATKVKEKLEAAGVNVITTRSDDTFIPLTNRAATANDAGADLFVSIHSNSSESSSTNGTSTYYYAPSSDPALYAQAEARKGLAQAVQDQLVANLGLRNIGILQANFSVLRNTKMPSILVETAFLSNAKEEALLKTDDFREKAADAIAKGITNYLNQ